MSRQIVTVLIVVALLAAIGIINYMNHMDPVQLAARGVGQGDAHSHSEEEQIEHLAQEPPPISRTDEDFVMPLGPEDAPVKLEFCYVDIGYVRDEFRNIAETIAQAYGDKVRIEFLHSTEPEVQKYIASIAENFANGVIVNGEVVKRVPGSAFGVVSFSGSPQFEQWSIPELMAAIDYELEQKGIEFKSPLTTPPFVGPQIPGVPEDDEHVGHGH